MVKKIFIAGILLIMVSTLFACGGKKDEDFKIDIGGEIFTGKPPAACQTRVMFENDAFARGNGIKITVGFGLMNTANQESFMSIGAIINFTIDAQNFFIIDAEGNEVDDLLEKVFEDYSDSKFVCSINKNRYIPNYNVDFVLKLKSDIESISGTILISTVIHSNDDERSGEIKRIYYAANSDKIAFSTISIANAQRKL